MAKIKTIEGTIKGNIKLLQWWRYSYIWVYLIAILAITFVTFLPALQGEFIPTWDDYGYAVSNQYINQLSWENVKGMFSNALYGTYNPLTTLSFAIEKHFFGTNPFVHHLSNLLLHLINILLVFWLFIRLRLKLIAALIATILFAIHPMRVESVAWITERKDVLFAVFYLGALISYIHYFRYKAPKYYVLCLFLAVLSLFSKIQAVALPLSMLAIDYYLRRKWHWKIIAEKIPFFILSLTFGLVGIYFIKEAGGFNVTDTLEWYDRLIMGGYSLGAYLYKVLIPYPLSAYYPYPNKVDGWFPMIYYITPCLGLLFMILTLLTYRITRIALFGVGFFLLNIVFLLQVVEAGAGFVADRFSYIAYIGLFFILAQSFAYVSYKKPDWRWGLLVLMGLYLIGLGATSFERNKVWVNDGALWTDVLQKYPDVTFAYTSRGSYYARKGRYAAAIADYDQYITLRPQNLRGYYERAKAHLQFKEYERAIRDCEEILNINPRHLKSHEFKAGAEMELGKYAEAVETYTSLIQSLNGKPPPKAYLQRAKAFEKLQNFQAAVNDYNKHLQLNPESIDAYLRRGGIYFQLKQYDAALSDINKVLESNPENTEALLNRAIIFASQNQHSQAIKDFDIYLQLTLADARAYNWRGISKTKIGDYTSAIEDFSKAIQSQPAATFYKNRANAYLQIGEEEKAEEDFAKAK